MPVRMRVAPLIPKSQRSPSGPLQSQIDLLARAMRREETELEEFAVTLPTGGLVAWIGSKVGKTGAWFRNIWEGGDGPDDAPLSVVDGVLSIVLGGADDAAALIVQDGAGAEIARIGRLDGGHYGLFAQNAWFGATLATASLKISDGKLSIVADGTNAEPTLLEMTLGDASVLKIGNETADSAAAGYTHTNILGNYLGLSPEAIRMGGNIGRMATLGSDGSGGGLSVRNPSTGVSAAIRSDHAMGALIETSTAAWNRSPLKLGEYHLWIDAGGLLRIKNGAPAGDTDGTIVGSQS